MKFNIHIGKSKHEYPGEWEWELSYEERRPHASRPVTEKGVGNYTSFEQAKQAAEAKAEVISRRHATQVNYVFET